MNKIFKVIWSKSKQCYIVVSEIAKNKTGKKKIVVASILATLALTSNVVTVHGAMPDGSRTDILGVAIGTGSASNSNQSVAIGYASSAQAPSSNPENPATAVGAGANANGAGAVALGLSANAKGTNAVALGGGSNGGTNKTEATADYATAIGFNAKATGSNSIAIGKSASITKPDVGTLGGQDSIAMGTGASAKQHSSISVGLGAASDGVRSVAIGPKASATDEDSIAIGTGGVGADKNNQAVGANGGGATLTLNGISGVQLYYGAKSTGKQSIAMGYTANAKDSGIAIGNYAVSDSGGGTAIGKSVISRNGGVVVGQSSNAIGKNSIAYGNTVKANGETSTAMGYSVTADGQNAVAVGYSNTASAKNSVSIGSTNQAKNEGSIAVGRGNNATNTNTVVIGRDSNASGNQSVAMGASANSKGTNDTAIGNDVTADGDNSVAIGRSATTKSSSSLAIGTYGTKGTSATGAYSIAMGRDVTASAESAIAIGKDAVADKKNAVAFGSGSDTSSSATAQSSTTIGGKTYSWNKGVLSGADLAGMQVSVGAAGKERQIKNVAAGEISANSTDAINGAQLYSVASGLAKDLKTPYVSIKSGVTGTGSNVDNDGATGANSIAIGPSSAATNQDGVAFGNNAQSLSAYSIAIGTNAKAESGSGITNASRAIAIGSNSRVATNVTQGIAIGSGSLTDEGAVVTGDQSIAIGGNVKVDGHAAIAIGGDDARKAAGQQVSYTSTNDVEVTGTLQTAIQNLTGYNLSNYKGTAASHAGVAYGTSALAGNAGVAIGTASDSMTRMNDKGQVVNNKPVTNAVAIGTGARANFDNSVAIGGGSNTDHYATKQVNAIIDGVEVKWAGGDNISPGDVVSFGAKGFERQLKNVAPGEVSQTSTDAINGSQIYSLARKVTNIMNGGAGSLVNVNASGEPLTKVVTGTGANKQEKYYRTVDVKDDGSLQPGAVAQTPKSLALVNVDEPNVNQQTQTPRTLGNVANGVKDNDAVNVSQLKAATVKYFSVNSTDAGNRDNTGATGTNAIAIGPTAKSTGDNALAIGNNAQANSPYAVALGHYANNGSTNSANSVSIGFVAGGGSNGASNVAIGSNAGKQVTGNNNISLGNTAGTVLNNNVYTSESILLGTNARVTGSTSSKSVNSVIAIGKGAEGSATSATALGINANASAENAMALGPSSKATAYNGVALGSFSEANTAGGTAGYNVNTSRTDKYAGLTGLALTANTGAVSIGNATTTRQITNLAAGTNDTDAVNVAQLKSVNLAVKGNSGAGGDVNLATNPLTIKGNDNYITTSASGNTVNISGKVQNISVSNGTAAAAVGMADAKNVAEAINNAVSQNAYTWNLTADNDTAGSRSTITKEGTVKFSGDQNITVKRDGNTISSSLNKSITVDSVKANNSVTTGSGSNQITLDGTTGAVTGKTFSGQSFTAGNNVLSNTTLQIGSPTNGDNNVTITKDGLTSKAGTKTAKFGANGIDAGGQQIANVSSGGNVGTNAANITDVKNAVSDVTLKLDTNSKAGTVKLSESPLKVIGSNGIRTDLVGTNNGSLVIGLDQATVNATTKGIGLTGDTGSTGNKYLKDGDVSFAVTGDGNLVSTSVTTAGVKVAVNAAKVKDLAVEAVTVSKDTQADNPITVTPTAGTNSKDYAIGIDTTKLAGKTDLTYRANNDTDANAQKVSLAKGLNFVNGDNTVATVAADGKVSYDLNTVTKTKIDDSATAVARNISLGADSGTASSQSLKDGNVAFNVKGATGDYVSTNMNGNTVEISTTRATINSDTNTGAASVTGNDGLATAKNVADAINKAADAAKAGAAWNLTTNSSATDKTSVQGGDTVDLINGDNIVITQDGTDKKKITVATKKDITVDSVTAGNTVINTSGLTNGTTAITGSGITTDKVTVGGISIDKTDGINAGGKAISNVASGGTTDTNAANIGDVKQAVANLSQNLNITDGTNNGTVDLKNQKLNVAGANGVTATVNNQTITVGLDADTVNATTKGIGLTADTGSTGNKYLKDGDVSFAVTGDGNLVSTSATAAGVKVAVDAAKVKDLAVDAVTVSKDTQADNPITVTPTAGTNSKDYAIGIDTTKLAAKTDLTYRANNDTDANAKKVSLAKGLNFVNGTLTTASIDTDGVVKYDVNTASITAGADGTVTGPTTDGVATAQNVADAINAAKKASKTEITANTGEAANATTGNVTLTSTTAADGHTIYDVKLNDTVTLGTGANAVTIDGTAGKVTAGSAVVDGVNNTITTGGANTVTLDGAAGTVTGLTNKDWTPGVTKAVTGRAATEDQLQKVADAASSQTWNITADKAGTTGAQTGTKKNATVGKDQTVELVAGDNLTINQDERKFTYSLNKDLAGLTSVSVGDGTTETIKLDGATGKITAKNASIGGVTVDGDNSHVTGLSNTTWNGTATTGRAATEDQLKAVADTAKATTDAVNLKFSGDTNTSAGVVNLKDDTFNIVGDGKYVTTDANGKDLTVKVSEAEVKKSAVAAVTVSTDTTDANNPISVTPTTSADGTTKDYKVTIDGTKIANKTNLSYKANDGTAKQVSLADGLNFKNGTLTTASIDDAGVVKYDVNTAAITAGTDGTVTGPTTDGVATAQNVADAINAAKKAAKTEITANTGEAANATTGNVTLTSTTAADGHTIYDVKLNDTVTLGTGANAVTIDGTAGKVTAGSAVVDGVNNTITTGGANAVTMDGAAGTVKTGTVTVTGGTTNDITGLSNTTVNSADFATKGRAATEEQLKQVGEQTWQITADKDATTSGNQTGTKKDAKVGKDDKVQLIAGENLTVNQNERDFTYSLNKDLVKMNSATFEATGGKTTVITGDSIAQTDGTKTNTSTAAGNTVADGTKSTETTAAGQVIKDGAKSNKSTVDSNVIDDGNGNVNTSNATSNTIANGADSTATTAAGTTVTNANGNTNYAADGVRINITGKNPVSLTDAGLDNGNNVIKNVASGHVNNDDTDNTNAANIADVKKATTTVTANNGEAANATTGNVTLTSTTAADGHTIYDVKLNDTVTLGTGANAVTIDGTAGKATIGSSVVDGVNNTITTGGANAVALDGAAGTVKTGTVTVTGGTTNDITGLSNTTVNSADFATKGRAATEEQLKQVGEQTWQITADKDATTSGNQTGTKKDAKVGKDDKVQLIAGENLTVNQNERDFTYSLNKDLVKMNSATFEATGGKTTVITGDSIAQTDGTKTNKSTAAGNTVADGGKSTATTADGTTVTNGADSTATTAAGTTVTNANGNTNYAADGVRINITGKNPVSLTDAGLDNGNNVIKNVASGHVNNDDTDNTNAANIADVKKATTTVTANNGEAANATTGNVTLTSTTAADGHTIYDVKLNDTVTLGTGANAVTIDGTAGKATIGSSVVDGVNNTITTGGANAVALDGAAGTVKTGTVTVTGGTTNDITGLSNTTVNSADFATKGRAATEEQLKQVGEQTWQITADKDATTSGNQTGTKKDAKVGKDDKVQLIAGENLTVNQNERDFTYSLNKDLVKMNSATFEATGGKTTVITGDSIAQTDGTKTNKSTAAGNTVADGGKSTATTADGTTVTNGADSTATTAAGTTVTNANGNTNYAADGVRINITGKNPVSLTDAGLDNGNNVIKNVASGHVNNDDTDNTNAANIADVKKATTTVTANNGEAANATTGNVTLTSTTAADGHTIYDVKLNDKVTLGTGNNAVTIDGTAGKATVGTAVVDGVNNTITTGGANAVTMDGAAGTVKTGTVTVTGGTTNDITGLSNTTVNSADFATKGRAATEEQLKQVGEQTWQITADKDATTSGNQTGTKKDAKVGKDDKVQLIAGENLTVNQNERDFTYSLNKDLVKMNSATFEATGGKTTVITGDSIAQTDGTKTNTSTAAGNTVADGTKSTETTAAGQVIKDGAKTNTSTVDENTLVDGAKSNKTTVDSNVIDDGNGNVNTSNATSNTITDGTNTTEATASTVTVKDNAGNSTVITKDTITTGTGANKVTVDGTAGKVTAGSAVIDGVNNTITTGGANTVKLDGAAGTVTGLTNTAWTPGVTKAVSGRAATEDQLQQVSDAVGAGWNINSGTVAGSTGEANGSAKTKISSGEEVQLQAGNNLIIDQNGKTLAYSLNKNLKDMESAIFNATGGKTTVIKGDSIVQTDGGKTNTSNAAGNTVVDGTKSTATTAAGSTITDGAKTNTNTADKNVIDDGAGNTNTSNATSNTIADPNGNTNTATATSNTLADNAGNSNVSNATSNNLTDNAGNSNVSNATSNTLKNAAGDETKVDAKGATVKDAAGNTTNVASTGATVTNAAGDTTKVEATGTTVADAAGNKATFTKDGVTITKPGKDTVSLTGNGLDNGNNKIVNVADGTNDTDAVNVRQLDAKTKAATTELTANGGESADNTTGNIVLTKTTAADGHIVYDNKLNDKITMGAADPTKAITVDGTNGTIKAGKDGNAVAINGTDGTIKAGDGTNAVAIDGVNGSVKVADKIALNGKDGKAAIGTVGIDGKDGIITTGGNNPVAVNGKDGVVTGLTNKTWDPNNITSGRAATEDQVQSAVANAGWDATVGTEGSGVNSTPSATPEKIRPNETLTFKAGNNMMVSHAGKTISYAVNPELTDMKSATFKDAAGNTTVTNGNGITITPGSANPNNPNAGPVSLTKDGLNNGNNQIKGVAPGSDDTDAVNIGQLKASNAKMGDAIGQVAGEVQRVGAHAAAMAALKPIQYDPLEPTQIMAGVGNYRGETAAALGLAHYTNEDTMFNVGVSVGGNHNMVNAGVTHKFGSSPEKKNIPDRYKAGPISSVYVMQDEVSSLKKENAEQKYVIANQAARLNTLEAENERQRQELAETKQGLDDLRAAVDKLLASKG